MEPQPVKATRRSSVKSTQQAGTRGEKEHDGDDSEGLILCRAR